MKHVPNAPCGVERRACAKAIASSTVVPNAPCGVESGMRQGHKTHPPIVPNAPCGVESTDANSPAGLLPYTFLMHRVELKA